MDEREQCPLCGVDLRGGQIPDEQLVREAAARGETWDGRPQWYSRMMGDVVRGVYDGVLYWTCPDCGGHWHRWPEGHHLWVRAEQHAIRTDLRIMAGPA